MTTDNRLMTFVTLPKPLSTSAQALAKRVQSRFGSKLQMTVKAPAPAGGGIILDINGQLITVLLIDQPLPPDAYARAVAIDRVWPSAEKAMRLNRAHAIVATLSPIASHGDALTGAAYVTFVTAALLDAGPAIGVLWASGDALSEASIFQKAADQLAARQVPVLNWMSIIVMQGQPNPTGAPTIGLITTGLAPFIGREIEFEPTTWPPNVTAQRLLGTAQYLMVEGPVIKDGDTLGADAREKIAVRHLPQGLRPGVPVMRLSAPV